MLTLPEELLLLALDDQGGRVTADPLALQYGISGAVLLELSLADRLNLNDGKLVVESTLPTDIDVLDHALSKIAQHQRPRDVAYWIEDLSTEDLREKTLDRLVHTGFLRKERHRVLWLIPSDRYPSQDATPEWEVKQRLRSSLLSGETPTPRTAALIGLAQASGVLEGLFSRVELRGARKRAEEIARDEPVGRAASDATQQVRLAMQAAIMTTLTASVVSCSTSISPPCN